jgi:hypothetical protein
MTTQLRSWARALGGEVSGRGVICAGPGHSARDRSLSVMPSATAPDGFLVHSFSGDDPIACKDFVRIKLGQPEFKPNGHAQPKKTYFDYRDESGAIIYQVERTDYYDGRKKKFLQRRPNGNADGSGTSRAFIPYLIGCPNCSRLSPMTARSQSSKANPKPTCFGAGISRRRATTAGRKSGRRNIRPT